MLIINGKPVSPPELKKLVDLALGARTFPAKQSRLVEFKLKDWRLNPEFEGSDPEKAPRRFLGPMFLSIPDKFNAPDLTNVSAVGSVTWRYIKGDGVKDDKGQYMNSTTDIEFVAGHIKVDVDIHPDLYVFLKLNPICINNPKPTLGASAGVFSELDPYAERRDKYTATAINASRIARVYNMDPADARAIAKGLKLLQDSDLNDLDLVRGALSEFASHSGEQFDLHTNNEKAITSALLASAQSLGVIIYQPEHKAYHFVNGENNQKKLATVPADRIADKEVYLAEYLLATDRESLQIIRNLATQ